MARGGVSATLKECPLCGNGIRLENLDQHFKKVHPGNVAELKKIVDAKELKSVRRIGTHVKAKGMSTGAKRLFAIGIVLVVVLGAFFLYNSSKPKPRLYADHNFYDLGVVTQTKVSHTFTFSNTGSADLTVSRIWTSCGCTTAKLEIYGIASPEFGMPGHGGYSGPWSASLKPGETANLIVYYDSTSMPDLYVGQREVFVDSDDPSTPEYDFTISVHEVP